MAINSMTGFARTQGQLDDERWYWELRSVNGRGLDIRLRLPPGMEAMEQKARGEIAHGLARGNVSATLNFQSRSLRTSIQINQENLEQVVRAAEQINTRVGSPGITVDAILNARGVLEATEAADDETTRQRRTEAILGDLRTAVASLQSARAAEGKVLAGNLARYVDEVACLTREAQTSEVRTPQAIGEKLRGQIARLTGDPDLQLNADRLHQEAVLLATKADIAEELDRLTAHVAAAREILATGSPAGRKLEFLVQELNREANTLCSKSNHIDITRIGLQMKTAIDQLREQVQNIE